ncbi:MAG: DotU family type IV/VI secretion system protein [Nitrospina sp.]|nr:DotU family type IV/VI secretion system protein [Nitrospina sp.]
MNGMVQVGDSFLLARFREFFHEVIRLKQELATTGWMASPVPAPVLAAVVTGEPEPAAEPAEDATGGDATSPATEAVEEDKGLQNIANRVWQRLLYLLEQQEISANRFGGEYVRELYKDAQFVMAALADEIFLHLNWEGREAWQSNLLETKLFQSHAAGDIFFQKVDNLLKHRDPVQTDLGKVYLMALAFGFQGKFRGEEQGQIRLDFYRRELFNFIFHRSPDILSESKHFCPESYLHNIGEGVGLKLEHPQKWFLYLALVVSGLLLISHNLWAHLTDDLYVVIQQILNDT